MPRIVSMIASATEIVDALGMLDSLVARSHECDYPESVRALPVCTRPRIDIHADSREIDRAVKESARTSVSIYDVLDDVLERAAPTHVLTQIQCDVCAVSLRDVELALSRGIEDAAADRLTAAGFAGGDLGGYSDRGPRAGYCGSRRSPDRGEEGRNEGALATTRARRAPRRLHRVDRAVDGRGQLDAGTDRNGGRR